MILEHGNMWDVFGKTELFLITTNPIIRKDGAVVMGRGMAKQAKDRFRTLPYDFGNKLSNLHLDNHPEIDADAWLCNTIGIYEGQLVGYFMVKDHWKMPASIEIIRDSITAVYSQFYDLNRIDLNFPGIGNGRLKREDVLPILQGLPDNVHVWELYEHQPTA